jgi:hypothetical protein
MLLDIIYALPGVHQNNAENNKKNNLAGDARRGFLNSESFQQSRQNERAGNEAKGCNYDA